MGLGSYCCNTWLVFLAKPGLVCRDVASVVLLLLGVVSYIVGLANVWQDWFPWIQWECSFVPVLQDVASLIFLWLFVEGVPLKTAACFCLALQCLLVPQTPWSMLKTPLILSAKFLNFSQAN